MKVKRKFTGYVVSGRPVTTEDGRNSGMIKKDRRNYDNIRDRIEKALLSDIKLQNEILIKALRNNAKPPIKGEITKAKLKYRGITFVLRPDGSRFLAQRGERISDIIQ